MALVIAEINCTLAYDDIAVKERFAGGYHCECGFGSIVEGKTFDAFQTMLGAR